jgi:hypothetical protein
MARRNKKDELQQRRYSPIQNLFAGKFVSGGGRHFTFGQSDTGSRATLERNRR